MRKALALFCGIALFSTSACALQPNDNTLPGQTAVGDDGYSVTVHFGQIENLVPNSTVQKDNVVIGTVASIDTRDWEAIVHLRLLDDVPLPADAVFSIGQKTLLGAQYVEVSAPPAPGAELLAENAVVPASQTGTYPATEQVLGAVALLLNNGGLSQISTITGQFATALHERVPNTRNLIRHANDLLAVLDDNRGEIVAALESLDSFSAGLREDQDRIASAISRIAPGLRTLEEERNRLIGAVSQAARTSDRAVGVIRASGPALLANLDSLGPILSNLGEASETLPEALKIGFTLPWPALTTRNGIKGDYMNLFTTLDLRGASLAGSWLSGLPSVLPPALQAGNPLQDPLSILNETTSGLKLPGGLDAGVQQLLNPLLGAPAPAPSSGPAPGQPKPAPTSGCLLALLGAC
ncbi:MCE family protein [Nocardioides cavernaquae]|uniref:MCE family protein n=1 Tax=Nocardioides cavernaquae TaxID=2321396 RepID=A0A3A5H7Z0_9ACTN|nr:MCE family protein [Nocardioides cavernaquae]RJS46773.1 MCE family protein [Nocardioides cavernaquae]